MIIIVLVVKTFLRELGLWDPFASWRDEIEWKSDVNFYILGLTGNQFSGMWTISISAARKRKNTLTDYGVVNWNKSLQLMTKSRKK